MFDPANAEKSIHEVMQNIYSLVQLTDYPSRAKALAQEILVRKPDVVCLQEVFSYAFSPNPDGSQSQVDLDFLNILLNELKGKYQVSSVVYTTRGVLPYEADNGNPEKDSRFVIVQDSSDVILTSNKTSVISSSNELFTFYCTGITCEHPSQCPHVPSSTRILLGQDSV